VNKDVRFEGQVYYWSKHVNFLRLLDLPRLTSQPLELALETLDGRTRELLLSRGWHLADAYEKSRDTDTYQQQIYASRGELTVAKDLYARTRCGWFSDRSVCYLARGASRGDAGTGFSTYVPTGRGLFAFDTAEEAAAALERDQPGLRPPLPGRSRGGRGLFRFGQGARGALPGSGVVASQVRARELSWIEHRPSKAARLTVFQITGVPLRDYV